VLVAPSGIFACVLAPRSKSVPSPDAARAVRHCAAVAAGLGWAWAVALLRTRHHLTFLYDVIPGAPPVWGFVVLPSSGLMAILGLGVIWAI